MPKGNPNKIKNKVKNIKNNDKHIQKYFPNQLKMDSKPLPGTLPGVLLQKARLFHPIVVPMVAKWEPRGSPKINKNYKRSKKEGPKNTSKIDTSKHIENDRFGEALGTAESS